MKSRSVAELPVSKIELFLKCKQNILSIEKGENLLKELAVFYFQWEKKQSLNNAVWKFSSRVPKGDSNLFARFVASYFESHIKAKKELKYPSLLDVTNYVEDQIIVLQMPALQLATQMKLRKQIYEWLDEIIELRGHSGIDPIRKIEGLKEILGKKVYASFFERSIKDDLESAIERWEDDEVDNILEEIQSAQELIKKIPPSEKVLLKKAKKFLDKLKSEVE